MSATTSGTPNGPVSYKIGLQQRLSGRMWALARVVWLSVSALASVLTLHPSALLHSSWLWFTVQLAILIPAWSAVGVLSLIPVQILRKKQLRLRPVLHKNRWQAFTHVLTSRETAFTVFAYALSWTGLFAVWIHLCRLTSPEPDMSLFLTNISSAHSLKSRAPQINPRLAYLAASTFFFAILLAARHCHLQLSVLRFETTQTHQNIGQRASTLFSTRSRDTFLLAVGWSFTWPLLWSLFKNPLLRTFVYPTPFRPFFAALYKQLGLSPSTILRSSSACLFCGLACDVLNVLLDVYLTQPIIISYLSPTPNATLLNGIQHGDPHTQHMAYLELVQVVTTDAKRRKAIFDDAASDPPALVLFMRACLAQLDKDCAQILNPSASSAPAPAASGSNSSTAADTQRNLPSVPVMSGGVLQHPKSHFLDRFAKTPNDLKAGPSSTQPSTGSTASSSQTQPQQPQPSLENGAVPSVFRNASQSAPGASSATPSSTGATSSSAMSSSGPQGSEIAPFVIRRLLGERSVACQWLLQPLPTRTIDQALPQPELDAWIAQSLCALLVHSFQEDTYGLAQKELPKTLEGLVQFSAALESLIKNNQDKHDALQSHVQPVLRQTSSAFSDIVLAFKPFMKEFKFSQASSQKINAVLDYR